MKSLLRVWTLAPLSFFAATLAAIATTATVTLTVNPPDAGKTTGAGSYTVGASSWTA